MKTAFEAIVSPLGTFIALGALTLVWLIQQCGPKVEGMLFPVIANTVLTEVTPAGDYQSRVWGSSERVRDCEFRKLEWFYGTRENYVPVDVKFEEASKVRPEGPFEFGSWLIDLNPLLVEANSFAIAYHECHPFFLTESLFYPSKMEPAH